MNTSDTPLLSASVGRKTLLGLRRTLAPGHTATPFRCPQTGRELVSVSLRNADGREVVMYAEDYARFVEAYGDVPLYPFRAEPLGPIRYVVTAGSIAAKVPERIIARFIADAPSRTWVKYLDGDPLNLRRSNLYLTGGAGGVAKKKRRKPPVQSTAEPLCSGPSPTGPLIAEAPENAHA